MSDPEENGSNVTRRELGSELRAFRNEMRLLIVTTFLVGQVLVRPDAVKTAVAAVVGGAVYLFTFIGGRGA